MMQFALTPRRGFLEFAPPQESASSESRMLLDAWIKTIGPRRETAIASLLTTVETHPLTRAAYAKSTELTSSLSVQIMVILEQLADAVPADSFAVERPIHLAVLDDESVVLEWILRDRRLGFSFEKDQSESGWFYVYSAGLSMRSESGSMDQLEMEHVVNLMIR